MDPFEEMELTVYSVLGGGSSDCGPIEEMELTVYSVLGGGSSDCGPIRGNGVDCVQCIGWRKF